MEYMPSLLLQTVSFVYSAGLGFCFGLLYDFFRMFFYLLTGSDKKLSTLRDIIYVLACLSVHFIFVLVMCSGRIMLYTFVGEIIGLTVYAKTFGCQITVPIKRFILKIRRLVKCLNAKISGFASKIFLLQTNLVKKAKKSQKNTKKDLQIRHNLLYNSFCDILLYDRNSKNRGDENGREKSTQEQELYR